MISPFGRKMETKKSLTNYDYLVIVQADQKKTVQFTLFRGFKY